MENKRTVTYKPIDNNKNNRSFDIKFLLRFFPIILCACIVFCIYLHCVSLYYDGNLTFIFEGWQVILGEKQIISGREIRLLEFDLLVFLAYIFPVISSILCLYDKALTRILSVIFSAVAAVIFYFTPYLVEITFNYKAYLDIFGLISQEPFSIEAMIGATLPLILSILHLIFVFIIAFIGMVESINHKREMKNEVTYQATTLTKSNLKKNDKIKTNEENDLTSQNIKNISNQNKPTEETKSVRTTKPIQVQRQAQPARPKQVATKPTQTTASKPKQVNK